MTRTTTADEPVSGAIEERVDGDEPASKPRDKRQADLAAIVFAAFVAVGAVALVGWLARYFWFHGDEWNYLVDRDGGNIRDLIHPRNEHLSLLPIATYRVLWNLFGLRSYVPYQIPVLALHLTTAVLLRAIMRRCGVNPWIATAAASVFVLFGPGEETIVWGAQIGQGGTLAYGLGGLLLADHEGPIDRRDWIALALGFLAFLSSGFSPFIVFVVGVVVLVRRGIRPALFQAVPVAGAYVIWYLAVGYDRVADPYGRATDWFAILRFAKEGLVATFEGVARGNAILAVVYVLLLAVGLPLACSRFPRGERLRHVVMPVSMLVAALAFLLVSGYGRWWLGAGAGASSRYVYVGAAFSLPALAVAADALARLWRPAVFLAVVLFASTIPYGIGQFDTNPPWSAAYFAGRRELTAALARSPYITQVPRSTRPDPFWSDVTAGWLLDALHAGKLPNLRNPKDAYDPVFRLRYGLAVIDTPPPPGNCSVIRKPVDVSLRKGDQLGVKVGPWTRAKGGWFFQLSYTMQLLQDGKPVGAPLLDYPGDGGHVLRAQLDHLDVRFALAPGTESFILCR